MEKKQTKKRHRPHRPQPVKPVQPTATVHAEKGKLKVIPLGGLGDGIGKNMMAIEYEQDILVVDVGVMFPTDELPGIDYIIPDISYLEARRDRIRAVLITHGHEDHIGAAPFILPKLGAPIFGSQLSISLVETKLEEQGLLSGLERFVINPDKAEKIKFGAFEVEFFRVAHAIPDACGIFIRTPVGNLIHTGDFKIDETPVFEGMRTDLGRLGALSKDGILMLMADSTNAEIPGFNLTERAIEDSLMHAFKSSDGRIIIASFSSQIARTQQIFNTAKETGRVVALSGRSMLKYVEISVKQGLLKIPAGTVVKIGDVGKMPDHKVVILSTGAQGESLASLMRMASGSHHAIKIKKGDLVILSSSIIPGNENAVFRMIDSLYREGARVLREGARELLGSGPLHVSGHANQEELKIVLETVKPRYLMPIHGALHHLMAHKELALSVGIKEENIVVVENGHEVQLFDGKAKLGPKHKCELILVDGLGIGDIQSIVLKDRKAMATDGIFVIILTVSKKNAELLASPDIISRGFIYMRESEELVNKARAEVRRIVTRKDGDKAPNWSNMKNRIREDIGHFLYTQTKRRPMVLPVVIEI